MNEKILRELFDAFYDTHIDNSLVERELAWEFWKKSSKITETYLKG